jgi:hypothetical protein
MMKGKRQMKLSEAVQIADFLAISQGKCAPCRRHRRAPRRAANCRAVAGARPRLQLFSVGCPTVCVLPTQGLVPAADRSCWKSTQLSVTAYAEHKPLLAGDHF